MIKTTKMTMSEGNRVSKTEKENNNNQGSKNVN